MTAPTLTDYKFWIISPKEAINYFPNPRFDGPDYGEDLTDYGASYSSAETSTYQRRGSYCMDITTAATTEGGVYYGGCSVTNGEDYVFSCDVKGTDGEAFSISIRNDSGTAKATTTFTATGYWQRVEVTVTADATNASWRIYVSRLSSVDSTNHFYTDGWQFEEGTEATTFIHGYGGDGYYWEGTARNSNSVRTDKTGMGGELLDIEDYTDIAGVFGLGMGKWSQIMTPMANGGGLYQRAVIQPGMFTIKLHYRGSMSEITEKRNTILDAIRPDKLPGEMMKIRFQGFDSSDDEATNPVDIICVPQSCHNDPPQECALNEDILVFTIPTGLLQGAYMEGAALDIYDELAVEHIVSRDEDGVWGNLDGGVGNIVQVMIEAPDKSITVGGSFSNAGSVAEADRLAKWDGSAWDDITGAADFTSGSIEALAYDANDDLYIGGSFINAGDADGDYIVKWNGSALSSLAGGGDGASKAVEAIAIDPDTGYVYVCGDFTGMDGVANTAYIAYWDGSAWNALGTGIGGSVTTISTLAFAPNGDLYIGGGFTGADGAGNGDYICYWDGTSFNAVGGTELNGAVLKIKFDDNGVLYAGGAFTNAGGDANADYIAKFEGNAWKPLGAGLNGNCYDIAIYDGTVYACGAFTEAGGIALADRIAIFSNGSWKSLDADLPGTGTEVVYSLFISSVGTLYISGNFSTTADGNAIVSGDATVTSSSGSANSYPFIQITGPGVLQSITNYTTGKTIEFDGLTLQAGEWVNLQCNPSRIKFQSGWASRGNLLRYVVPGSDIADFYIKPGTNHINVLMPSGYTAASGGTIHWYPKFWSIEGAKHD